jgi:hypothetical protein
VIRSQSFSSMALLLLMPSFAIAGPARDNPAPTPEALQQQVDKLVALLSQEESALKESQQRIDQLRKQVVALQADIAGVQPSSPPTSAQQDAQETVESLNSQVSALREQQELQQSEIATHEQTKVESASRFPVKITGLILVNAFSNSSAVDVIQSPTVAGPGSGVAGLTLRQSVVGLDARGPEVFGAKSAADFRVDFFGNAGQGIYPSGGGTARFRTAHAELTWETARAFVALDRPILNPTAPASLNAVAQPALSWSGNLWNWMPQAGAEYTFVPTAGSRIEIQGALADIPDPPALRASVTAAPSASLAEQSRRPGSELRVAYGHGDKTAGLQVGVGGYFSPHREGSDFKFNAWAATLDYRIPVYKFLELSGNAYRGAALGGLGAGAFKDYVYRQQGTDDSHSALDDVGGWAQLKARLGERLEFNTAYGLDNAFASELRPYLTMGSSFYQNLARNSTIMSNVIYSPTAYTLFSVEYRRIDSSPAAGAPSVSNVYGVAAGYRF